MQKIFSFSLQWPTAIKTAAALALLCCADTIVASPVPAESSAIKITVDGMDPLIVPTPDIVSGKHPQLERALVATIIPAAPTVTPANTTERWLWTVEKITRTTRHGAPEQDETAAKKALIHLKPTDAAKTQLTVDAKTFDQNGEWAITLKAHGIRQTSTKTIDQTATAVVFYHAIPKPSFKLVVQNVRQAGQTFTEIVGGEYAYIFASPAMPGMQAQFAATPGMTAKCEISIAYDNTKKGYTLKTDTDTLKKTLTFADEFWNITADLAALPHGGFWGGKATFKWELFDANGKSLGKQKTLSFYIRGENPTAAQVLAAAKSQIIALPPELQRANGRLTDMQTCVLALAKLETGLNQFNWKKPNAAPTPNSEVRAPFQSGDGVGVGLMQVTFIANTTKKTQSAATPQLAWNWQANLTGGIDILKSKIGSAKRRIDVQIQKAGNARPPTMKITVGKRVFEVGDGDTPKGVTARIPDELATAIKFYNGFSKNPVPGNPDIDGMIGASDFQCKINPKTKQPITDPNVYNAIEAIPVVFWNPKGGKNGTGGWDLQTETLSGNYVDLVLRNWP